MDPVRRKALLQLAGFFGGLAAIAWVTVKLGKPLAENTKAVGCHACGTIRPEK